VKFVLRYSIPRGIFWCWPRMTGHLSCRWDSASGCMRGWRGNWRGI